MATYGLTEIAAIFCFALILRSIKIMHTRSRYLYRYIVFCIGEVVNSTLYIIQYFVGGSIAAVLFVFISIIFLMMTAWRIIEVTILNAYFDSLTKSIKNKNRNKTSYEWKMRKRSYLPPNQSLFAANVTASVQSLLTGLALIFD